VRHDAQVGAHGPLGDRRILDFFADLLDNLDDLAGELLDFLENFVG
jgi:hypothetical protein